MDNKQIGNYIRNLRIKMGLTQGNLAEQLEVSRQAVSKWENGVAIPDVSLLPKLSKILDMDIEGILFGEPHELAGNIVGIISLWRYEKKDVSMTDIVNNKPLIIYPLSMLFLCGIKNIVICGPNDSLLSAKIIINNNIQKTNMFNISYSENLDTLIDNHVVLIDGNSYLYGIDLTRYLQRTIIHKNTIACIVCATDNVDEPTYNLFPFISIPVFDDKTNYIFEECKTTSVKNCIENETLSCDLKIEIIGRGMLSFEINTMDELSDFDTIIRLISKTQHCDISNPNEIIQKRYSDIS